MKPTNEDDEIRIIGGENWLKQTAVSQQSAGTPKPRRPKWHGFRFWLGVALGILLVGGLFYYGFLRHAYGFNYPVTRSAEAVIESLEQPRSHGLGCVTASRDSLLGVTMNFYKLTDLRAELDTCIPNLDDTTCYFVTRSADYRYDGERKVLIGDYIHEGEMLSQNTWRAGYLAIVQGKAELGIGRGPVMRNYIQKRSGSMFRQFALVSAGVKCISQYVLKGKVTRCAYARMPNGDLFYVETLYPETLYGFSDALIEYGFADAVYVTGGSQPAQFYRDAQGIRHGDFVDDKNHTMVVWRKW